MSAKTASQLIGDVQHHLLYLQNFLDLVEQEAMDNCRNGKVVVLTDAALAKLKKARKAVDKLEIKIQEGAT